MVIVGIVLVAGFLTIYFKGSHSQPNVLQNSNLQIPAYLHTGSVSKYLSSKITGWVHSDGMKLIDESGKEVRFVGLTANGMEIGSGYPGAEEKQHTGCNGWQVPTQAEYDNFVSWGFNSARVPLSWANLEPMPPTKNADGTYIHQWNQRYLQDVDTIVSEFGKRGIPIIIGLHQFAWSPAFRNFTTGMGSFCQGQGMPVWTLPDVKQGENGQAFCDFFADKTQAGVPIDIQQGFIEASKFLAERYHDNKIVMGIDMFNEPYVKRQCSASQLHLDDFYKKMGTAIRLVNQNILLIFEDSGNKGGENNFSLSGPIPFNNTMYDFHTYPKSFENAKELTDIYLTRAKKWNVPLWVGEWGAMGAQKSDITGNDLSDNQKMLKYWKDNNLNWTMWAYWGGWGLANLKNDSLIKPNLLNILQENF